MRTHRIDLGRMTGRQMLTPGSHEGEEIVCSEAPIYDAARWLLEHGRAHSDDRIETWRGEMMCLYGVVGTLAEWTVVESDAGGLRMKRWADVLAGRDRLATLKAARSAPSTVPSLVEIDAGLPTVPAS